ncbi:MAG: thiopurine S-methyltransferase [Bacteriovoracaceae bacterium]|jgi:thiopurine S-methyltransferase
MKKEFWLDKWTENSIGFHQSSYHPLLVKHFKELESKELEKLVLVPLCGKTLDMIFLKEQGYKVIGSEFSEVACHDFFVENKIDFKTKTEGDFKVFESEMITLYCGDYFKLKLPKKASFLYDRAAIVALDPKDRQRYAKKHAELLAPKAKAMVLCFEYDQSLCSGPPFSVEEYFVREYFEADFDIELIEDGEVQIQNPRMIDAGLSTASQKAYLLNRKAAQ